MKRCECGAVVITKSPRCPPCRAKRARLKTRRNTGCISVAGPVYDWLGEVSLMTGVPRSRIVEAALAEVLP